jgi:[phosphatase 2A protein]-leucine-carboxy methyltransferase
MSGNERCIRDTADEVIRAKHATVKAGYYADPFISAFAAGHSGAHSTTPVRHVQPIIKRGTYARVCAIDRVVAAFLQNVDEIISSKQNTGDSVATSKNPDISAQIVILGVGKDTLFFRLHNGHLTSNVSTTVRSKLRWYEVDHEDVLRNKVSAIHQSRDLFFSDSKETIAPSALGGWDMVSTTRHCRWVPHDLRTEPLRLAQTLDLDKDSPTLFIMECVQMYLPLQASKDILQTLRQVYTKSSICCYEPVLQHDAFGQMMEANLCEAGIVAQSLSSRSDSVNEVATGLLSLRTVHDHLQHLTLTVGFDFAIACDMWAAYETVLTKSQRQHANRCEFLDELEEFMLIMRHYCLVVASTEGSNKLGIQTLIPTSRFPISSAGFVIERCLSMSRSDRDSNI